MYSWESWYARLLVCAEEAGIPRETIESCGMDCWGQEYDSGISPEDALRDGFTE